MTAKNKNRKKYLNKKIITERKRIEQINNILIYIYSFLYFFSSDVDFSKSINLTESSLGTEDFSFDF